MIIFHGNVKDNDEIFTLQQFKKNESSDKSQKISRSIQCEITLSEYFINQKEKGFSFDMK